MCSLLIKLSVKFISLKEKKHKTLFSLKKKTHLESFLTIFLKKVNFINDFNKNMVL